MRFYTKFVLFDEAKKSGTTTVILASAAPLDPTSTKVFSGNPVNKHGESLDKARFETIDGVETHVWEKNLWVLCSGDVKKATPLVMNNHYGELEAAK